MKYKIVYFLSFVFICYIWAPSLYKSISAPVDTMIDSSPRVIFDTAISKSQKMEPIKPEPQIIYVKEPSGFLGMSNQVLTFIVSIGNIILFGIQFRNRKNNH